VSDADHASNNVTARFSGLIEQSDVDELLREIDRLCADRRWGPLFQLREQCRTAVQRGKQLWPVAAHAEYRIALEAPGSWAAQMLEPGTGRFTLGPIPEVAASTHTWDELAHDAPPGPVAALAGHERVVRGDDLTDDGRIAIDVLELPLALQSWEPAYPVAHYEPHQADFPSPAIPRLASVDLPTPPAIRFDDAATYAALRDLVAPWTAESNGRAETVGVAGGAPDALAALGVPRARMAAVPLADALAHMAWAAASGGAHGRRRGMATGRFSAWWALAAVAGILDSWPVPPDELAHAAEDLRFYLWDAGEPDTGWSLRLAVADPAHGIAWALSASDSA
jgi:hypothetical protein